MLENIIHIKNNDGAELLYFDVKRVGRRAYELHWMMPGNTPESVQTGIVGKVFRNHLIACVWARREAVVWQSENYGRINGYAPSFDIWDAKYDS